MESPRKIFRVIFERGFTGYNGREHQKSTGIGLYLCKTIIQKLGHSIRAESRVGVGTKIYISLERENVKFRIKLSVFNTKKSTTARMLKMKARSKLTKAGFSSILDLYKVDYNREERGESF